MVLQSSKIREAGKVAKEYEIVSHAQFRYLHVFLVRLISRTPHIHRELELGMILDGTVSLRIGTEEHRLKRGDLFLVNPLDAHEFLSEDSGALVLSFQMSPRLAEPFLNQPSGIRFGGSPNLREHYAGREEQLDYLSLLCLNLAHAYLQDTEDAAYRCFALAAQLFFVLKRDLPNQVMRQEDEHAAKQKANRILSVIDCIEKNFTHKLLLEDIAKQEGLSMTYLSHLFKDSLGISFQDYLKEKRFAYACHLIVTTQRRILDISVSSGFSDVRYLTRVFMERFGCTPKEYRKNARISNQKPVSPAESTQYFFTQQESLQLIAPLRAQMLEKLREIPLSYLP